MGMISLILLVAAIALLLCRGTTEDPAKNTAPVPVKHAIYPGCKVAGYHRPEYSKCLKRVTCKWITGSDFPAIAKNVREYDIDELHIKGCHLPGAQQMEIDFNVTPRPLRYLQNLKGLHIEGCNVKGIENNTFDWLIDLRWLSLINVSLSNLPPIVLRNLKKLEKLDLSRNSIGNLTLRIMSTALESLILRGCSLGVLDILPMTGERVKLTMIDVTDNNLHEIARLPRLLGNNASLYLDHNPFDLHGELFGEGCRELSSLSVSVRNQRDIDNLGVALGNITVQRSLSILNASSEMETFFQFDALANITMDTLETNDFTNWWMDKSGNPFVHLKHVRAIRLRSCADPESPKRKLVFPSDMQSLESLSLNYVNLDSFHVDYPLISITSLDLSFGTSSILEHEHDEWTYIKSLNFSSCNVEIRLVIRSTWPSRIEELILRNVTLVTNTVEWNKTIWLAILPSLRHLDLSANSDSYYPHTPFFTAIVNVNDSFMGLENLEQLELNDTDIGAIDKEDLQHVFRPLSGLKRLDLDNSRFSDIPEDTFVSQTNLEELHLADNAIRIIGHSAFRTLVRLNYLDLRNNRIEYIPGDAMRHLTSLPHGTFVFTGNNFDCRCDLAEFTRWLKEHAFGTDNDRCEWTNEKCASPLQLKDTPILNFQPAWLDCDNNLLILTVSSVFSIFLILSTSVAFHSYRRRLSIRYWYVMQKLRRARSKRVNGTLCDNPDEPFDVFVSFELNDKTWVEEALLPKLENSDDIRFRVCTVDRDLNVPGRPEVINIAGGIRNSRNVIFVVTREFVRTSWCEYEISLAETQSLQEGTCRLVIIFLEKVTWDELPVCLKRLLSHVNFLRWPEAVHERNEFWQRLRLVLLGEATESLTRVLYTRY